MGTVKLVGFLIFGRSWWGPFLLVAALVLLTLLLAAKADLTLGLAFVLLISLALAGPERLPASGWTDLARWCARLGP